MPDYHVYSTLTSTNHYTSHNTNNGNDMPIVTKKVTIHGGTNIPDKHFVTPMGVLTTVSAEDMEALNSNPVFNLHKKNGFITVSEKKDNPEAVAADMNTRDKSAPLVPEDFDEDAKGAKPKK